MLFLFFSMLPIFQAGQGSFSASLQDDGRTELSDIKGHLEIALLEKHFLREYSVMAFIKILSFWALLNFVSVLQSSRFTDWL